MVMQAVTILWVRLTLTQLRRDRFLGNGKHSPHVSRHGSEQKILEAFGQVKSYSLTADGDIQLSNADGKAVMLLEKRDPQVSARELNGVWNVKTLADTRLNHPKASPISSLST